MENLFELNFTDSQVKELSSTGLAHVGDGVYELLCRSYLCCRGDRTVGKLHKDTVSLVRASTQAKIADVITPILSEEVELRLPLEMSPGREAACRAVFGTWGFFRTMHGKTAPSC